MKDLICPRCHDRFRKWARYQKHIARCPGKVCRNCGQIGHLACGNSLVGEDLKERLQQAAVAGKKITIVGWF